MPYKTVWVEPEVFLEHNGVTVYHTYLDDDIAIMEAWNKWHENGFDEARRAVLKHAIDQLRPLVSELETEK